MIKHLYEILSKQQKNTLASMNMEIVESFELGNYEMYLVSTGMMNLYYHCDYQIGFQRSDSDFTSYEDQFKTFIFDRLPIHEAVKFVNKLKEWIEEYGKVIVHSFNEKKTEKWERILLHFNIKLKNKKLNFNGQNYIYKEVYL